MSTKPHEETWEVDEEAVADGDYSATDSDGFNVLTAYSREGEPADHDVQHERAASRIRLAAVAPEMARALLAMGEVYEVRPTLEEWHLDDCIRHGPQHGCTPECETAQAALKKARVLP